MNLSEKVTVSTWYWENRDDMTKKEKRMVEWFRQAIQKEEPPISFQIEPADGYRVFLYPAQDSTEEDKHKLLAWLVRHSNKKFERTFCQDGRLIFWNQGTENEKFEDKDGIFTMLILFERAPLGNCKIVEVEKTVKVKELVCS